MVHEAPVERRRTPRGAPNRHESSLHPSLKRRAFEHRPGSRDRRAEKIRRPTATDIGSRSAEIDLLAHLVAVDVHCGPAERPRVIVHELRGVGMAAVGVDPGSECLGGLEVLAAPSNSPAHHLASLSSGIGEHAPSTQPAGILRVGQAHQVAKAMTWNLADAKAGLEVVEEVVNRHRGGLSGYFGSGR